MFSRPITFCPSTTRTAPGSYKATKASTSPADGFRLDCMPALSEQILQRELNLSLRSGLRLEGRPRYRAERRARCLRVRQEEVGMIREVEHFGAELDRLALTDGESAIQANVEIAKTVSVKNVAARIAECVHRVQLPCRRVVRSAIPPRAAIRQQRARIEPSVRVGVDAPVADNVRPVRASARVAFVASRKHREGAAALKGEDAWQLPSSPHSPGGGHRPPLPGQVIHAPQNPAQADIVIR